jgi:hypothetical protein
MEVMPAAPSGACMEACAWLNGRFDVNGRFV